MKKFLLFLLSICGLHLLNGCGSGGATTPPPLPTTHFSVIAVANSATAGTSFNVTVSALDASGTVVSSYSGTVHFTSSDAQAVLPKDSALSNGAGTFSVTLKTAGTQTVTATDSVKSSVTGSSNSISVVVPASHFSITAPSNATTGIAFNITVTALDATNNTVTSYSGTVHFTSTDGQATLPVDSSLANGTGTFSATLKTLGNQTITATDSASASVTGISSAISVGSTAATHFSMSGPLFGDANPGSSLRLVVTALDAANNTAPTYSGTVHFTSTDPLASLPGNSTLTNGSGTFSATLNTVGSQTITATDTVTPSITGASHFNIAKLTITSGTPPGGSVGVAYGTTPQCYSGPGFALGASGGNPGFQGKGYVWSSTSLPPGLQIGTINYVSGSMCSPGGGGAIPVILGAPTQAGTYKNVVITLHDNETPQATASATYTITIGAGAAANHAAEALATLDSSASHHHYKLVDLGTLGGPHSYGSINGDGFQLLNNSGVVASYADTALPDPNASTFCFDPDCFLGHAFLWKDGTSTDLGALTGMNNSAAGSINSHGLATGQSQISVIDPAVGIPEFRAVLWKHDQAIDLGTLGGTESLGIYVNDANQVVGFSGNGVPDPFSSLFFFGGTQIHTFVWENGVMRDIGTLGGPDAAPGSSCSGQPRNVIVGLSYTSFTANPATTIPTLDPFLWKDGVMTDLGNLGGMISGPFAAPCVNNRGQVIGVSDLAGDLVSHAFFWENGVMTDLGTLGGDNSEAIWLNDAGVVVGSADLPGSQLHHAVYWSNGEIHDLGTVAGDPCSRGRGLNARGQVVGLSSDCFNALHAFVWEEGGPMLDLNTLIAPGSGWQLTRALNINDRGEILVAADPVGVTPTDDDDLGHLVLLVPCDAGEAGCEESAAGTTNVAPFHSTPINNLSKTAQLTPLQKVADLRARWARQYHVRGAPKK